jgi:hypothetical protein
MTKLLDRAFRKASELPPEAQDELAKQLLAELENEERWSRAFEGNLSALDQLAHEAVVENKAGRTEPLDPNSL